MPTSIIVGYPGQFDLPAARLTARGRPIVFNPLVSLHDTLVTDRARFRAGAVRRADAPPPRPVSVPARGPRRRRHATPTPGSSRRPSASTPSGSAVAFVGAEDRLFRPAQSRESDVLRPLRRQARASAGNRDDPRGCAARAGDPVPDHRGRAARSRGRGAAGERHAPPLGRLRRAARGATSARGAPSASSGSGRRPRA